MHALEKVHSRNAERNFTRRVRVLTFFGEISLVECGEKFDKFHSWRTERNLTRRRNFTCGVRREIHSWEKFHSWSADINFTRGVRREISLVEYGEKFSLVLCGGGSALNGPIPEEFGGAGR